MSFLQQLGDLFSNVTNLTWQQLVMWIIGGLLIYLAIKKDMEPTLLLPMGFGAILVNLPNSGAVNQWVEGVLEEGPIDVLFAAGIANELFPLLLFIGIGAMIDFGPLLTNPKLMIFGAAAQFGIFFTLFLANMVGFDLKDAASIAIIGAADGPTSIFVANYLGSNYTGAIMVWNFMARKDILFSKNSSNYPPAYPPTIPLIESSLCSIPSLSKQPCRNGSLPLSPLFLRTLSPLMENLSVEAINLLPIPSFTWSALLLAVADFPLLKSRSMRRPTR